MFLHMYLYCYKHVPQRPRALAQAEAAQASRLRRCCGKPLKGAAASVAHSTMTAGAACSNFQLRV
jgi:hypothetical protein